MRRLSRLLLVLGLASGLTLGAAACDPRHPTPQQVAVVGAILRHKQPFLICVRRHESDRDDVNHNGLHDGGYAAENPYSDASGAFQFLQSTWNTRAGQLGRPDLIGRYPATVSVVDQDYMAWSTYVNFGPGDWNGSGCY